MDIKSIKTSPYDDQICGTSGLRKKISVVKQENYLENFVQSIFNSLEGFEGKTLVIGGDGRYFNNTAIQKIIKIAIANQFGRLIIGQNGILSTPAASHLIVKRNAFGGIILSASHNPGGPNGDFGIKFDTADGAPAPQNISDKITEQTKVINHYWMADIGDIKLSEIGEQVIGSTIIEVVDSVRDYASYMQEIFDFEAISNLFKNGFKMSYDALNAVTGPYASYVFETLLGAEEGTVLNKTPLPDFGGLHPEPNLTYAKHFVEKMYHDDAPDFGAASDGDGDRYMILGKKFFVAPSDSLAIIAEYMEQIPFYKGKFYGVARSMPTAPAVDKVMMEKQLPVFATPTGWKFFSSLLNAKKISLCGEESFGTGSFHLCEKDGIWAVLFWLNIIALTGKSVEELNYDLWHKYGRVFTSTQSYEGLEVEPTHKMMTTLKENLENLVGQTFYGHKVIETSIFDYIDPITGDTANNQGYIIQFEDGRIFSRLSGTGSSGATLRMYYSCETKNQEKFDLEAIDALKDFIAAANEIMSIKEYTGKDAPTVIT